MIGSSNAMAEALVAVIDRYNWTKISIIFDQLSSVKPLYRPRVHEAYRNTIELMRKHPRILQYFLVTVDSGTSTNFTLALIQAAAFSPSKVVIVFLRYFKVKLTLLRYFSNLSSF